LVRCDQLVKFIYLFDHSLIINPRNLESRTISLGSIAITKFVAILLTCLCIIFQLPEMNDISGSYMPKAE